MNPEQAALTSNAAQPLAPRRCCSRQAVEGKMMSGAFLYNSQFHPPRNYSIRAEFKISPEYIKEQCASRVILPPAKIQS